MVEPVVGSLIRADEHEKIDVRVDMRRRAFYDIQETLLVVTITACGEDIEVYLGPVSDEPWDASETADFLYDQIEDEIRETRFAWGEQRTGHYAVLPPKTG